MANKQQHDVELSIRAAFKAFATGDAQKFFDLLSVDVVFEFPESTGLPWSGRIVGKTAVAETLAGIAKIGTYTDFRLLDLFVSGPNYMIQMSETFKFFATGESITLEQVFLYKSRDGEIVEVREWTDTAAIRDAYSRASSATGSSAPD